MSGERLSVGGLSTATSPRGSAAAVLTREVPSSVALTASATSIRTATTSLSTSAAAATIATAAVGSRLGTALLNHDLLAIDHMRV